MKFNDTQYYYQGYSSHQTGLPYESSPHPTGDLARLEWCRGWRDAENDSRKRSKPNETDSVNQQFESLASKPTEAWGGDGLPPAGCICEAAQPGEIGWGTFKVIAVNSGAVFGFWDNGVASALDSDRWKFRPTLTEEERKRDEACSAIKSIIVDFDLESVENRGDEMDIAKEIFFSIRAGKIPHIKLEACDE